MRARFEAAGGTVLEHTAFRTADLYRDAVVIQTASQAGSQPDAPSADAQPSGAYHGLDAEEDPAGQLSSNLTDQSNRDFPLYLGCCWTLFSFVQYIL